MLLQFRGFKYKRKELVSAAPGGIFPVYIALQDATRLHTPRPKVWGFLVFEKKKKKYLSPV